MVQHQICHVGSLHAVPAVNYVTFLMVLQEVEYEHGEELHTSRSDGSEKAAILLIVAGHIDTVLVPLAPRLSGGSSASRDTDEPCGPGSNTNSGDDFSLGGDIIGAPYTASSACASFMLTLIHAQPAWSTVPLS
jgi:hypothetical protein